MHVLVTFEIQTPYADWHAAYQNHSAEREAAGITEVYCGHDQDNTASIFCLFEAESLAAFNGFMMAEENAAKAVEAGHLLETTKVVALT